jgi:two-component system LytT family response regulator
VIRVLIVDDEPPAREQVREFLSGEADVLVVGESADGEDAVRQIRALGPDLLFMDIRMPRMSGLEVLSSSAQARLPYTIFTTAYARYAVEAFAVEALDYLVKPLERGRFRDAVARARRYLARDASLMRGVEPQTLRAILASLETAGGGGARRARLAVRVGRRVRFLEVPLIEYIRADGDYVTIHLQSDEVLRARDSIADLQTRLPTARFLRIHRSLIVNLDCVKELRSNKRGGYTLVTASGRRLAAGATYASAVQTLLAK